MSHTRGGLNLEGVVKPHFNYRPHPKDDGGGGTPFPGPGWGGWRGTRPPIQVRSQDEGGGLGTGGGYPLLEQHSVYLLRGGRYASCVHAGGFSCF